MTEITLISSSTHPLQPLIEAALMNEIRLLEAGLEQTEKRLRAFETVHGIATSDFVRLYTNDEISENLDTIEWLGEYHMRHEIDALKGVRFAH